LVEFLEEKVKSVKKRVKEATGVDVEPIYYSAGSKDDEEQKPWNLSKLLYYIVKNTPTEKRLSYVKNISDKKEIWEKDDGLKEYQKEVQKSFIETIKETAKSGGEVGKELGEIFGMGKTGEVIGSAVGTAVGVVKSVFDTFKSFF